MLKKSFTLSIKMLNLKIKQNITKAKNFALCIKRDLIVKTESQKH